MTHFSSINLPIDSLQQDVELCLKTRHLIIQADTGTGKSTRLPVWAMSQGRVLVIEPRRVACTSLASFVAQTLDTEVGGKVGYAIKFDPRFSADSRIVFATPGVVLRWFSENALEDFDVVMIDEFHERRAETDLLAALLRKKQKHRLIITSATLESGTLAAYFDAVVLKADAKSYGVTISHHAESQIMPSGRDLEVRVKALVENALERGGDVLVFLPGKKEISQCQSALKGVNADVIPLHASVSDEDRRHALYKAGHQRVVLATNVAETSLTIPGVITVIDTGLERRTHQRNGRTALALHAISKASAKQRAGRAGRVEAGFCERLYGQHAPLEAFTPPELEREELTETMLASACCGYPLESLTFLTPLPEKSLRAASERLQKMAAIDAAGLATDHGKTLYPLPIDSLFAHLISGMTTKAHQEAMVDLTAILQTPMKVWQRRGGESELEEFKQWNPHLCDVVTSIAVLRGEVPQGVIHVDELALEEARKLAASIREALNLPQWEVASRYQREGFLRNVMDVSPELVYVRREKRQQAFGNGHSEVVLSRDSDFPPEAQATIVFDQFHLAGRGAKQTTSYATCMAPIRFQWIIDAGLTETLVAESITSDGVVVDILHHTYAGRVIGETQQESCGRNLLTALAQQILSGECLPGVAERIENAIRYWNLYQVMEGHSKPQVIDVAEWLEQSLQDLGVESAEDMALIDGDDLHFEGIPEWEFDDFTEKYPLELVLPGLHLSVEYQKGKRTVVVHHQGGQRKEGPKRWELPRWSGWKIQYRKASRLVDVK